MTENMPTAFISHGVPTVALEDVPGHRFLEGLGSTLGRPRAIVVISAHWETLDVTVSTGARLGTIHDFFGCEPAYYELYYPVDGARDVADDICERLSATGIRVNTDAERGLDHGAWIPLRLMYPAGDIPVTQISICPAQSALFHWRLGRTLATLRHTGVLILGSGSMTHNLNDVTAKRRDGHEIPTPTYAVEFCDWVADCIANRDSDALLPWRDHAPHATRAHPSDDHFLPLHVAMGAAGVSWTGERVHQSFMYGLISMDSYIFKSPERFLH